MFNNNRIALISANDGTDVRIGKTCRSLSKMSFDVHFIGWDRRPEIDKSFDLGLTHAHIMTGATSNGRSSLSWTTRFMRHIARNLQQLRPSTVCCVDEEYALLTLPMRHLFYRHLVCDVFDPLYDRHSFRSWPVRNTLRVLGFISRLGADRLIATDINRYERLGSFKEKCIVVENYPEDPGEDLASTPLDGPIRIYAGGSMSIRRGLERLIDVVETTPNVEIISAGWLYDNYATNVFAKHPKVSFHGIVKANESLRLAAKCDAIFAFYEPNSVNNRQASPNKVYDAMSIGRPIIINQEASVSKWIVENNLGFRLPYNDTEGLRRLIEKMEERRRFLPKFVQANRQLFNEGYCWEKVEPRLYELYRSVL